MENRYGKALKNYTYDRGDKILSCIKNNKKLEDQQDIINMIILWKVNRQAELDVAVLKKLLQVHEIQFDSLCNDKKTEGQVKDLLSSLIQTKGIRLPIASTILHFYNPDTFPIIDQRAYRELYKKEAPRFTEQNSYEIYIKYIKDCYKYWEDNCECVGIEFSDVDKILYRLDKNENKPVRGYGKK